MAYEVRIYSISGSSFGEVIWAKRIRAAHCLTSLQFSPTSEHILLAYGRSACTPGHSSLQTRGLLEGLHNLPRKAACVRVIKGTAD